MKTLNEKDIQDLLTPRERPVPPADLAERIKQEIPEDLPVIPDVDDFARRRPSHSRVWLMAASVLVAVGGGFLAFRSFNGEGEMHRVKGDAADLTKVAGFNDAICRRRAPRSWIAVFPMLASLIGLSPCTSRTVRAPVRGALGVSSSICVFRSEPALLPPSLAKENFSKTIFVHVLDSCIRTE